MIRKVLKILIFTVGGLLSALLAALTFMFFFLQTPAGGRFVGTTVQGVLKDNLGLDAKIGSIRVNFFRTAVTLLDLSLSDGKNPPVGAVDMVYVEIRPLPLLYSHLVVKDVVIEKPRGHIVMKDGAIVNLPKLPGSKAAAPDQAPKASGSPFTVEVNEVEIRDGRVRFEIPGRLDADLKGLDVRAKKQGDFYDLVLSTGPSTVVTGGREFTDNTITLKARGNEKGAEIRELAVVLGREGTIRASGAVRNLDDPYLDVAAAVDLPLDLMPRLGLGLPDAGGRVKIDAKAKGTIPTIEAEAQVIVEKGRILDISIGDVQAQVVYGKKRVEVKGLTVRNDGVDVGLDATLSLDGDLPVEADVRVVHLELHRLLESLGVKDLPLEATLTGRIRAKGQILGDLRFKLHPDLHVIDFAVLGGPWRKKTAAPPVFAFKKGHLGADAELTPRGISIGRGRITLGEGAIAIDGARFMFDEKEGMHVTAVAERLDLGTVSPLAGFAIGGTGSLRAEVKGPYSRLAIAATTRLSNVLFDDFHPGELGAAVKIKDDIVTVTDVAGRKGKFQYTASAVIDVRKALTIAAEFATEGAPLQDILSVLGRRAAGLQDLRGSVTVKAKVQGPPDALTGAATVAVTDIVADAQKVDRIDVAVKADKGDVTIEALTVALGEARVVAQGTLSRKGFLNVALRTEKLRVSQIAYASVKKYPFDAIVDLKATIGGAVADPAIEARLSLSEMTVGTRKVPPSYVDVALKASTIEASLNMLGGALNAKIKSQLGGRQQYSVAAEIRELAYPLLIPGGDALKGRISAELSLAGSLADAARSTGELKLSVLEFEASDMKFALKQPTTVALREGTVSMDPMIIGGEGIELTINSGQVSNGQVNLTAEGSADLSILELFTKDALTAEGAIQIKLNVTGKLDALDISGGISLEDGSIQIEEFPHPVEKIALKASITSQKIRVDEIRAEIAEGAIEGGGEVDLEAFVPQKMRFGFDLRGLKLRVPKEVATNATGRVTLEGDLNGLLVGGDIVLEEVRYTENIDWLRLAAGLRKKSVNLSSFDKEKEFLKFDVGLKADSNIIIKNELANAEFKTNLRITGSSQRVGIIGMVSAIKADISMFGHGYEVKRALIQFKDRYRIAYSLDVQAETKCREQATGIDHLIRVDVSGDEKGQNVLFRDNTSPPMNETVIVQCLVVPSEIKLPTLVSQIESIRLATRYSQFSKTTVPMILVGWKITSDVRMEYASSVMDSNDQNFDINYRLNRVATLHSNWGRNAQVPMGNLGVDLKLRWDY